MTPLPKLLLKFEVQFDNSRFHHGDFLTSPTSDQIRSLCLLTRQNCYCPSFSMLALSISTKVSFV